jgi:hypothetical protein
VVNIFITEGTSTLPWIPLTSGVVGAVLGSTMTFTSTWLSDRRKRKADDERQWDKEVRDLYLDVAKTIREYEQLSLRVVFQDQADMDAPTHFLLNTKRERNAAHNMEVQPQMRLIVERMARIVERAEIISNETLFRTITDLHVLLDKMTGYAHDGIVIGAEMRRVSELRGLLLDETRKSLRRAGEVGSQ